MTLNNLFYNAYKAFGDIEFSSKRYYCAFSYYSRSLDYFINNNIKEFQAFIYNRLGVCRYETLEYSEAYIYLERAYYHAVNDHQENIEDMALYNLALCLNKLGKYTDYFTIYLLILI